MIKQAIAAIALLVTIGTAVAQTNCPPPTLKVMHNDQVLSVTGAALVPKVTLLVSPSPDCPNETTYQFREAEVTLMRGARPLTPTKLVRQPEADLREFMRVAQAGDRLYIFVRYENLAVVSADGRKSPYARPAPSTKKQPGLDLTIDESKGIGFNWIVR